MADIRPFKGLRYNSEKVKLEEVITEPYDRIPPQLQEEYYERNPHNVVRIILGKDDDPEHPEKDKYRRANIYMDKWESEGILIREDSKALYIYEQEYKVDGAHKKRMGLIARVKLEEFSSRKVLPHEKTFPKHKIDRLNLLRATNANTGQIFLLYKDDERDVTNAIEWAKEKAEPGGEVKDEDGFIHRLWIIKEQESIQRIQEAMADKVLIIADGHHRYETSLNFRKEMIEKGKEIMDDEPFNFIMMTLFRLDDPGLVILPTYRLVRGLDKLSEEGFRELFSPYFDISEVSWKDFSDRFIVEDIREKIRSENHTFAAFVSQFQKFFIFKLKSEDILDTEIEDERSREWKRLDVAILHSLIIDKLQALSSEPFSLENNVSYIRKLDLGLQKVIEGEFQMIFFLKPVSLDQIREVVENGELMPQKSTDFYPKLKSGLVLNPLDE
ncbi:MAG: DUF1015 domain-containing protein [Candidatus Aminicenantes bacterium]|nr:MAG: DUF1015 domain-containing protein [Candidatus Aminicenantes bacterium]